MTSNSNLHACRPPAGTELGERWQCPSCWAVYRFRPVQPVELRGRIVNLWMLVSRPSMTQLARLRGNR